MYIWFSNLNLGTNLLVENVPSPCLWNMASINPANQNLVILLLMELGIHLPDMLLISFLHLIITNFPTCRDDSEKKEK